MTTKNIFNRLATVAAGVLLMGSVAFAQANTDVAVTVTENGGGPSGGQRIINFGVNTAATNGTDVGLGEVSLPPFPPSGVYEARFVSHGSGTLGQGSPADYRPSTSATQTDLYKIKFQVGSGGYPVTIAWSTASVSAQYGSATITDPFGGAIIGVVNMKTTAQVVISNAAITEVIIETHNPVAAPQGVSVAGCPLAFGVVQIPTPGTATRSLTLSKSGASNVTIDSVKSDNPDFTISAPASFPQTVGSPLQVDVLFTAAGPGAASATITIYFDGNKTTTCTATATASSGEGLYFAKTMDTLGDNTTGHVAHIGLKYSGATPAQGLQFKINVPNNLKKITGIALGSDLLPAGQWIFDYEIQRALSGTEVKVLLYGRDSTITLPDMGDSFFDVFFDVSNIKLCNGDVGGDDTTAVMYLSDVQSALATSLGESAGIGVDPDRDSAVCRIFNSSARGDVNCDDKVDVLDLLIINDNVLGRGSLAPWQKNRADLAPWNPIWATGEVFDDANNYGDNMVNVQDLVLITNAILNEQWPDNDPLQRIAPVEGGDVVETGSMIKAASIFDVKLTYEVSNSGIKVSMFNKVPVKGFQMKLKATDAPADLFIKLAESFPSDWTITYKVINSEIRIVAYANNASIPASGVSEELMEMPFAISNPMQVLVIEPITIGDDNNQSALVEYEVIAKVSDVKTAPSEAAFSLENMPNPFNGNTTIRYTLPKSDVVTLVVTDVAGKEVSRLVSATQQTAGEHAVEFNAKAIPSGVYFYTLTVGGTSTTRRMVLAR